MKYSHVFISRPRKEAEELAGLLTPLGLKSILQPAFNFLPVDVSTEQKATFRQLESAGPGSLIVFTSPRAVAFGVPQLPTEALFRARIAAIGPATVRALNNAGVRVNFTPGAGFTSETLLESLASESLIKSNGKPSAFIVAAPGGRMKLLKGLEELGWQAMMLLAYKPEPAQLDNQTFKRLQDAEKLLSVWTSANAMKAFSQRFPPAAWFQICSGDWLVISGRLKRLARAYGPSHIHLAAGPGNTDLCSAIRSLI